MYGILISPSWYTYHYDALLTMKFSVSLVFILKSPSLIMLRFNCCQFHGNFLRQKGRFQQNLYTDVDSSCIGDGLMKRRSLFAFIWRVPQPTLRRRSCQRFPSTVDAYYRRCYTNTIICDSFSWYLKCDVSNLSFSFNLRNLSVSFILSIVQSTRILAFYLEF